MGFLSLTYLTQSSDGIQARVLLEEYFHTIRMANIRAFCYILKNAFQIIFLFDPPAPQKHGMGRDYYHLHLEVEKINSVG